MAESCTQEDMSAEKLLAKRVQDMVLQGEEDQLPSPYVCRKKDQYEDDDHAVNLAPIPIIDLNQAHVDPEELQSLKLALCSWGCFQVDPCIFFAVICMFNFRSVIMQNICCRVCICITMIGFYFSGNWSWDLELITKQHT